MQFRENKETDYGIVDFLLKTKHRRSMNKRSSYNFSKDKNIMNTHVAYIRKLKFNESTFKLLCLCIIKTITSMYPTSVVKMSYSFVIYCCVQIHCFENSTMFRIYADFEVHVQDQN